MVPVEHLRGRAVWWLRHPSERRSKRRLNGKAAFLGSTTDLAPSQGHRCGGYSATNPVTRDAETLASSGLYSPLHFCTSSREVTGTIEAPGPGIVRVPRIWN